MQDVKWSHDFFPKQQADITTTQKFSIIFLTFLLLTVALRKITR